ncbi:MAG TPA: hypothetical protein VF729_05740 [Solirubrobacterales bacterium]
MPSRDRLTRAARAARERPALIAFPLALTAGLLVALAQGEKFFHYDSAGYWSLSEMFVQDGHFSLVGVDSDGLRGYALPLLYWALRNTGEVLAVTDSLAVRVFNAAGFALIGTVLAPRLATIVWPQTRWSVTRRLVFSGLLLVFWSGYLSYPLSDFPALALGLLALVAIFRGDSPPWLLVAGLAAGFAINTRPSYALLAPVLVALLVWGWLEARSEISRRRWALGAAALLSGLAIASVPQSIVQHSQFGDYSPLPGSSSLSQSQYRLGLELQRYDTYLGGEGKLEYVEPHTAEMVAEFERDEMSGGAYLELFVKHPVAMAGLYLRHIVNGFDQRYTTPYVETLEMDQSGGEEVSHRLLRIAGFLIVFLALLRLAWPAARRSLGEARWRYLAALLVISLTAIPSAMDTRYLLPTYMAAWMLLVAPGWRVALAETWAGPRRYQALALVLVAGFAYSFLVWTIVSEATDNVRLS